jgi:protein-S-isoprenylcysteine O-methyltransferase Ste14
MIKLMLSVVIAILLTSLIYLNLLHPEVKGGIVLSLFAFFVAMIKIWESFYTSNEKNSDKYHGDWTLIFTSLLYFISGLLIILEFFFFNHGTNLSIIFIGLIIFVLAATIRRWGIKTLGNQWAIHVTGDSKLPHEPKLIIDGPYKYVRHPIYLTYILDLIGIALIFNAYYSLFIVLFLNVISYTIRAKREEESSIKRFGDQYLDYKKKSSFLFPFKIWKK